MKPLFSECVLVGLTILSASGCLITRHNTNVIRKNEKLRAIQFESAQVQNIFEGKLAEVKTKQGMEASNPRLFAVPFLLWYSSVDVVSENGFRNDQLTICDSNGDGLVTNQEIALYASRVDALPQKKPVENGPPTSSWSESKQANTNPPAAPVTQVNPVPPVTPASYSSSPSTTATFPPAKPGP